MRWVKHDRKWFVFAVKFFVPPVFQLRGDSFNVADLNFGLGFDARGRASSIVAYECFGCAHGRS